MTIETIADTVKQLQNKYDETDPFRLAKAMKITVKLRPMGIYEGCCKGFFLISRRMKHITINSDLPELLQKVVLSHELGHCVLHADSAASAPFHEVTLFDNTDHKEYEANIFAAELLLPDEQVLALLNDDLFFFDVAKKLCVPFEMLDFKFRVLKRKGYKVESPVVSQGDFLKKQPIRQHLMNCAENTISKHYLKAKTFEPYHLSFLFLCLFFLLPVGYL